MQRSTVPRKKSEKKTLGQRSFQTLGDEFIPELASTDVQQLLGRGMKFPHFFVKKGEDPYSQVKWVVRSSQISGAEGKIVFEMKDVQVPETWTQLATDIAVSKYFRKAGVPETGHETSVRQLVYRVAHTIREAGEELGGYFASRDDADSFENELTHLLLQQKGAFNSPVWFNCGLYHRYGIEGTPGNWKWDSEQQAIVPTLNAYANPQCSACFIQSVNDDLMDIFELAKKEARIFKYGSGSGTNYSKLRAKTEKLAGGGYSSGLMSFLEVLDRGAGATKSGGTTRRAAKMVCLDMDHPEIEDFINWKVNEEKKARVLIEQGGFSNDFNGEAFKTVSGQNSNNSVRISNEFMEQVEKNGEWQTTARTTGETIQSYKARKLWDDVAKAAWACADPGVQFDSTIQAWHTASNTDRINASNPCSEYMFLDDSACNLSSLNLVKFLNEDGSFDIEGFRHAARILITAQEILVDFSSYPTDAIARNSHDYRPLGLGYANLGTLLMLKGTPYDSDEGRCLAALITALMHGEAYRTSIELAKTKGPFPGYLKNADCMMRVIRKHESKLATVDARLADPELIKEARQLWQEVVAEGSVYGFRNAQVTVLAPTGTIGLLMDCDTTGIEPDFALVKFKKLAGGGYFKIVNQSVPKALATLGYTQTQVREIVEFAVGTNSVANSPHINKKTLLAKGLNQHDLEKIEKALPAAFDLNMAVSTWILGDQTLERLGVKKDEINGNLLAYLGFSETQIKEASKHVCGHMTLEGAPHLKDEHLAVFDCANKCGADGKRFIQPMAHVRMMAAVQPFLSGAISKTVNVPNEATVEDIKHIYTEAWKLGLKAIAIYRDGSKVSQPLSGSKEQEKQKKELLYTKEDLEEAVRQAVMLAPARRRRMPVKRHGMTIEGRVAGNQLYLRTGEYEDGHLGEIFIDMHKEGATFRSLLNCFAIAVSMGLQYGVPLEEFVNKFTFTRFEPQGIVDHPNIKQATSILDFIFRVLGMEYLGKTDFVHVKPEPGNLVVNQRSTELSRVEEPRFEKDQLDLPLETAVLPQADAAKPMGAKAGLDAQLTSLMGDAPMCSDCGHTTVRNGSCYRCLNCGSSMGCS